MKAFSTSALLGYTLILYSMCSLTAMAGMNLGFLLVFIAFLVAFFTAWVGAGAANREFVQEIFHSRLNLVRPELNRYRFWALALFFSCMLSLIAAALWPYRYADHAPDITLHGFLKIWYLMVPFFLFFGFQLATRGTSAKPLFRQIMVASWLMTIGLALMAIIQFNTGWPLEQVIPTNPTHFHAVLLMGHHLSVASVIPFPTFTALAIALGAYTRSRKILYLEAISGASGLLILFLTYARTAWLAIPIGIVFLLVRYLSRKQRWISLTVFFLLALGGTQTAAMKDRIWNSMGIEDRLRLWKANFDFFLHRPFTGIGWLKTQEMSEFYFKQLDPDHYHSYFWGHAHSNFFEMLGGTGLIGLIAFLGWTLFTFRFALHMNQEAKKQNEGYFADFAWGIFIGLILLHFNGLTNVTFWEGKVMHAQMFAVALLFMVGKILEPKEI